MKPGDSLGPYEIKEPLGAGGMGEVYRARDPRLDRDVAIKVLPEDFAVDPERLARFEREAKAIAAIDHPSIVTIHSVERDGGVHFITTQLIEGRTLDEVVPTGGLELDALFDLAIPLADAVASAHERGIAHRDLKPGNVMVTDEGRVKVVDFGLAKLSEPADEDESVTRAGTALAGAPQEALTEEGKILGTVAYMSPEQAEGKLVDHRTDIFSLGVLLYEMATGARPFEGDTKMSVMSAILRERPTPVTRVKSGLPRQLGRIIEHALEKEPERRFQSAKDVRNELQMLRDEIAAGELEEGVAAAPAAIAAGPRWAPLAGLAAVALVSGLALGYALWGTGTPVQTSDNAWLVEQLTWSAGIETSPSISPDGQTVVYAGDAAGNFDIYTQRVGGVNAFNLTANSPGDDVQPSFSPDGELIVFRSDRDGGGLFIMGATGEQVRKVADDGFAPAFSPDGAQIVAATFTLVDPLNLGNGDVIVIDVESGERRVLLQRDFHQPEWSPDGRRIAVTGNPGGQRDIWTVAAEGGEPVAVTDDPMLDWNPVWSPDGRFLYFASDRGGGASGIWRVAVDPRTGGAVGAPEQVTTSESLQGFLSVSGTGNEIIYASRREQGNVQRVAFDPVSLTLAGAPEWVTRDNRVIWSVALSPDDQQMSVATKSPSENLYTMLVDGSRQNQITNDPFRKRKPSWSPDGQTLLYYGNRDGEYEIWAVSPTGGSPRKFVASNGETLMDPVWSPDGSRVSVYTQGEGSFLIDADSDPEQQERFPLPQLDYDGNAHAFRAGAWSPDGARLAGNVENLGVFVVYALESGTYEVFDVGFPFGSPRWLADNRHVVGIGGAPTDRLLLADTQSGTITELLSVAPDTLEIEIDLTRDSRWIYLSRLESEVDLYLLRRQE